MRLDSRARPCTPVITSYSIHYTKLYEIKAPFAGQVLDVDPDIAAGTWVAPSQPLGILVDPASWTVEALVPEAALARIAVGDRARLHLRGDALTRLHGRITSYNVCYTKLLRD